MSTTSSKTPHFRTRWRSSPSRLIPSFSSTLPDAGVARHHLSPKTPAFETS